MGLVSQLWSIPLIIALETLPKNFTGSNWVRYAISSLIVGYPYAHATLGMLYHPDKELVLGSTDMFSYEQWQSPAGTLDRLELELLGRPSTT